MSALGDRAFRVRFQPSRCRGAACRQARFSSKPGRIAICRRRGAMRRSSSNCRSSAASCDAAADDCASSIATATCCSRGRRRTATHESRLGDEAVLRRRAGLRIAGGRAPLRHRLLPGRRARHPLAAAPPDAGEQPDQPALHDLQPWLRPALAQPGHERVQPAAASCRADACARRVKHTSTSVHDVVRRRRGRRVALQPSKARSPSRQAGRHALLLDIGRKMGSRYRVDIDGETYVDFTNLWLPPTMSFFADLAPGTHRVTVEANDTDEPSLYYGPVEDRRCGARRWPTRSTTSSSPARAVDDIMATYRDLLGATPMLPLWSYGYVHCRERFHSSDEIVDTLDEFRRRKLPVDVMVQDWQYWGKYGWNAMRFDEDHYPDPAALVRELHRRDARLHAVGLVADRSRHRTRQGSSRDATSTSPTPSGSTSSTRRPSPSIAPARTSGWGVSASTPGGRMRPNPRMTISLGRMTASGQGRACAADLSPSGHARRSTIRAAPPRRTSA